METKRQRTRILLKAAIGGAAHQANRPNHHVLEISDGSETSDSFAQESEMITSLNGSGMHYDHTAITEVGVSHPGRLPVSHSSPIIATKHASKIPKVANSASEPINDPSVPRPLLPGPSTPFVEASETLPSTTPIPRLETYFSSTSSVIETDDMISCTITPTLSMSTQAEEGVVGRIHPRAIMPQQNAQFLSHPQARKTLLKSEPKVPKKHHKAVKLPVSRSSTDSSPSPRSLCGAISNSKKPPRSKPPRNRPGKPSRLKKNQVHPEPQHTSESQPASDKDTTSVVTRSFSPTSTMTYPFDAGQSSTSMLTPLLTSSLRIGDTNSGRWGLGGESQLEAFFPDRHIRVYVMTWNMQERRELPPILDDLLLPLSHNQAADMYVIGTQESTPSRREWELLIQKTLGPYYVLVQSAAIGVIYMCFFIRRDLIWFCSATTSSSFATRPMTIIKTKGAVGISFALFGSSFLFITSHFTASRHKVAERNSDMHKIATNLTLSDDVSAGGFAGDVTSKFDYVFWLGDLNYRVDMDRHTADKCLAKSDIMSLLLRDQLTREILRGNAFRGFSEQPISFAPSYKFDLNSDEYDTSEKQRVPSWTDRILFKSRSGDGINGLEYTTCDTLRWSDHRPVCAIFRVRLDASHHVEGVPSTVAGFDRELYMRANRQRSVVLAVAKTTDEMDDAVSSASISRRGHAERRPAVTSQVCAIL